jgi:hypothetical protein
MTISGIEQFIYNTHLRFSRNGQGWRPRKDFSDITPTTVLILDKLKTFFHKFSHIKIEDFFEAPLILHPDETYPPLKYFTSRAAIKAFTLSQRKKIDQSPDHQLEAIKEGFEFIVKFCLTNSLEFEEYPSHKKFNMPSWLEHYRLHQVNPYCFMSFTSLNFDDLNEEDLVYWAPNLKEIFNSFKNRYHNSIKAKPFCKKAFDKLKNFVHNELQKKSLSL